jgi:hypothetical protein
MLTLPAAPNKGLALTDSVCADLDRHLRAGTEVAQGNLCGKLTAKIARAAHLLGTDWEWTRHPIMNP